MRDEFRRISDFGSGVAELTFNRAEQVVKEFMRAADLGEESASFVREWIERGKRGGEEVLRALRAEIKDQVESLGLATKQDVERLETRIMELEALLARAGAASGPGAPRSRTAAARASSAAAGPSETGGSTPRPTAARARPRKSETPPHDDSVASDGGTTRRRPPPKTSPGGSAASS